MSALRAAGSLAAKGDNASAAAAYRALLDELGDDDYQAAAVLHMYAIVIDDPRQKLQVNEDALARAIRSDQFPPALFASLLANLGYSHRELGDVDEARSWYTKAKAAAAGLDNDDYGLQVRAGIERELVLLDTTS